MPPTKQADAASIFFANLPLELEISGDPVERRLLSEYGSVFVARGGASPPSRIVFRDQPEVAAFQSTLDSAKIALGPFVMELQAAAVAALQAAADEAGSKGLSITPRGVDSGKRSYDETVALWNSRVEPALIHWVAREKISNVEADRIAAMSPFDQVPIVLGLEETGIYFAKDLSKSILYSVAPPGTSQHLSMLALDVTEFNDRSVCEILGRHGWFQTVVSDLPHFTFLGMNETDLPSVGLKKVDSGDRHFWVPDI